MAKFETTDTTRETRPLPTGHISHGNIVTCPFCGCTNVHLSTVMVFQKPTALEIGFDQETNIPTIGDEAWEPDETVRGSAVSLGMFCEHGCEFNAIFAFHKGQTKVWSEFVGKQGADDENRPELWRD